VEEFFSLKIFPRGVKNRSEEKAVKG